MYVFLDESGNVKGERDDVFIVGGFVTNNPKTTAKVFRKQQQTKFFKGIRYDTEVKFSDTRITDALRLKTLNPNIQIADWICGALYRHHMQRRHGNLFYDTLHPNLKASQELFKDYWDEFRKNKKSSHKRDDLL